MKKEENQNLNNDTLKEKLEENVNANKNIQNLEDEKKDKQVEKSPEEKFFEIEDKLTRTLAEMEIKEEGLRKKKRRLLNMEDLHLQKRP